MWVRQAHCHISAQARQWWAEIKSLRWRLQNITSHSWSTCENTWLNKTWNHLYHWCLCVTMQQFPWVLTCMVTYVGRRGTNIIDEHVCVSCIEERLLSQQCSACWWSRLLLSAGAFCESERQMEVFLSHLTGSGFSCDHVGNVDMSAYLHINWENSEFSFNRRILRVVDFLLTQDSTHGLISPFLPT